MYTNKRDRGGGFEFKEHGSGEDLFSCVLSSAPPSFLVNPESTYRTGPLCLHIPPAPHVKGQNDLHCPRGTRQVDSLQVLATPSELGSRANQLYTSPLNWFPSHLGSLGSGSGFSCSLWNQLHFLPLPSSHWIPSCFVLLTSCPWHSA